MKKSSKNPHGSYVQINPNPGEYPIALRTVCPMFDDKGTSTTAIVITHQMAQELIEALQAAYPERRTQKDRRGA